MADEVEKIIIEVEEKGVIATDKAMESLNDSLKENSEMNKEATEEAEEYNNTLTDTIKDTRIFGVSLNSLSASFKATTGAIKTSVSGLKLFKIALAATGIGLLVIALGSLVTFFNRSQEGADKLSQALRVIGNVINVLLDRVSDFGGGLVKLFSGDIRGGLSDMRQAFVGIGEAIAENIERAIELERQLIQLREASLNLVVQEAAYRQVIAQNREIMNDTNQLMSKRLKAGKAALDAELQLSNVRIFNLNLQKDLLEEGLKESKTRHEDLLEIAVLEAAIINAETQRAQGSIRIRNRLQALEKEGAKETVIIEEEKFEELLEIQLEFLLDVDELLDDAMEREEARDVERRNGIFRNNQAILKAIEEEKEAELAKDMIVWDSRAALAGGIAALFGQNSKIGKAAAVSQAIIDTWGGVNTILRDPLLPTVAKPGFIAAAIAQGLASVRRIQAVPLPQVEVVETPFGQGGVISGASHRSPAGGVRVLAEGGEFIMNKRSMAMPGVAGLMESINSLGSRGTSSAGVFAHGGHVPSNLEQLNLEAAIQSQRPVLVVEDFFSEVNTIQASEDLSSL